MTDHVLYFGSRVYLSVRRKQLVVVAKETGEERQFPMEDIGLVEIDSPMVTVSGAALQELAAAGAAVAVCGPDHLPAALMLPLTGHTLQQKRRQAQRAATKPLQKRLWQATVAAKLRNQAAALDLAGRPAPALARLAKGVQSGDADNREAQGARVYWPLIFGDAGFRRDPDGPQPNNLLNYGYAVLRALTARAIVAAGLAPEIGIFHRNQYNPFPLADDLMEPFRPVVDLAVLQLMEAHGGPPELNRAAKARLLTLPQRLLALGGDNVSLQTATTRAATRLARIYLKEETQLTFSTLCTLTLTDLCGHS